jgi:hypothetical protein
MGRSNLSWPVIALILFTLQVGVISMLAIPGFAPAWLFGGAPQDVLGRPALSSTLPTALPGWHKRHYLPADGEAITSAAHGQGFEARLAMGGDLERFGLYAHGGADSVAAVYISGEKRIAIGLMRDPVETPEWASGVPRLADPVSELAALRRGDVVAIVGGIAFYRRNLAAEAGETGYDRFFARIADGLMIDVISNAPQPEVERLLGRMDATALAAQLTDPTLAPDAAWGVVLHHLPETWPDL